MTLDVSASRATDPLTRMFPVLFSRDYYCIGMSHGDPPRLSFVMLTFSRLCLLFVIVRLCRLVSSPGLRYALYDDLSLSRAGSSCAQSSTRQLYSLFTYPIGRYFRLVLLQTLRLLVLVSYRLV